MSPRAAWRLESLGFEDVYEYVAGKSDWLASGMPREGRAAHLQLAGDAVRTDVAACAPGEHVAEVLQRVERSGLPFAVVVGDRRVVLGRVPRSAMRGRDQARIEDIMDPGPSTVRASEPIEPLIERMAQGELNWLPVTTPKGVLIGIFERQAAEARLRRERTPAR